MATKLEEGRKGGKVLVAGPLKKTFFVASLIQMKDKYSNVKNVTYIVTHAVALLVGLVLRTRLFKMNSDPELFLKYG